MKTIVRDLNQYSIDFVFNETVEDMKVHYRVSWDDGDDSRNEYVSLAIVEGELVADTSHATDPLIHDLVSSDNLRALGWSAREIRQGYLDKWEPYIFPDYIKRGEYLVKNYSDLVEAVGARESGENPTAEEALDICEYELMLWLWLKVRKNEDFRVGCGFQWRSSLDRYYMADYGDLVEEYLI